MMRKFLSRRFRAGTTFAELLVACVILAAVAGAAGLSSAAFGRRDDAPRKEAELLARWLTNVVTISNRSGRSFKILCPYNTDWDHVVVEWENPARKETYASAYGCKFRRKGMGKDPEYTCQWGTFTPAASIRVTNEVRGVEHYAIVSGAARVRTNRLPPKDGEE